MSKLEERYEQWKKNRGTQVQSSSVKQPTIEDRYNAWKARTGYVSPSQTDLSKERSGISDRVQSWLKQNDQITADYNGRYGNRKQNQYIADSEDWMSQLSARKKALDQEKRDIYRLISGYNDDWANTIREALDNGTKNQLSILDTAEKDAEYWSQWADENTYRENEERILRHNKLMGYDTAAGAKEIQNMDDALEQYSQIMNQLNSGGRGYYTGEYAQIYDQKMSDAKAKADELINTYGDMEVLEGTLAEKRKSQKEAEDYQRMIKNMFISDPDSEYYAPDFDKYSQYVPNENGTYEYINNPEARKRYQQSAAMTGNSALNPFADKNYELMRDDEIATYNYYYAKEGPEAAQKYLDSIQESLNYRSGAIEYAGLEDSVPLELLYGIKAGEDQFQSGMESLFNSQGKSKAASDTQIVSSMIREDLGEGSLGQVAYDVINNTSNMLPSIFVGMLNPIAGAVTMGASAAGSGYQEMIDLGYSQEQAASYGALVGASESLLQYALGGISKLGGKLTGGAVTKLLNNVDNALARVAIKLGGNMLSEASEESLQEILSPWFESIITGTEYDVDMGDVFYSGLLGALTAGLLESGSTVSGEVELAKQGAKLQQTEGAVESLVNIGKATPVESVAYRLANKVDENTGAYTVGRLFNELGATLSQQNIADITKSLVRKGVAESDATTIAEYFKNVVNGYAFTQQQAKLIEANEDLARTVYDVIINPKSTVNQRMDGYRSIAEKMNNPAEIVQPQNATSDVYDAEALERIAATYGKHAEAMKHTYNPGQNVDLYAKSYDLMYNYGKEGVKREYALNQKAADYLTPEQREIAYDTGATLAKKPAVDAQDDNLNASNAELEESYTEPVGEALNGSSATIYDGDAVSVASIKSINNGVVTFALEDGRSATADQLSFGNEADSVLYSGIAQIAPDAAVANDLVRAYQNGPKMDVSTYLQGVKEAAENYGANNIPMNEMETTGFAADLTPAQRRIAYKAGQKLAGMGVARAQSRVSSGTKSSRTGKVHYETSVDTSKLNAQQKAGVVAIERLAEALGIDFYIFESKVKNGRRVGENGSYNPADGSIRIDLYAGANGEGTMLFTVAHELTHFIKQWSPAKFKVLANFLMQEYGKSNQSASDLVRAQINKAKANNRTLSYEEAYEEMVADSMEIMLADGNVVEKLARLKQQDRTLWQKIKDFISDLAVKIRKAYEGLKPDSAEGKLVAEMKNAVDRLQELFTEAVVDASENYAAFEDMSNEEAFEDSSVAIHYQIRPPYTDGSRAFNEFTDSLSPEARKTFDLFYGFYQNSRITNTTSVSGKRVKAVNISALYLLADDWNAMLQKEPKWAEAAQKLADFLPKNVRERMNMNEDGTLNPTMLEKEFKMPSSMAQRLVDALPVENIDAEYTLGDKEITLPEGKARQSVGGEAYRRAIIAETRKLFAEGKLKQVGIGTMSKDRWGSLGFLAANGKTGASGDFTTVCPQMMFNRGCWYCYRRAAMEKGVNNKLVAQSVWYTGEILRIKDSDIQSLNRNGGLRIQSFGDWMPHFSAMLADVLYDAEQRGLQVKIITKEPSMINYIAALRSQGVGKNLYFNLSADYTIEKGPAKPATDSNSLDAVNPERPFTRIDNSFWWKRAMTVEEAAKYREKYPWVNTRIVATTQEEFIRGLKDDRVDVVTGYHGNIREYERVDSTTGEHKVQVEALGDAGMPRFAYNPATNEWVTEYEGKTSTHKALAKAIADNGLQYEYYIKTCCITGRCATCQGKCGALAKDFNIKNATNRDAESVAYWQREMQYGIEPEFGDMTVKYSDRPTLNSRKQEKNTTMNDDVKMSIRNVNGNAVVWVEENILKEKNGLPVHQFIANYISEHIGEVYTIIESGDKVYIGKDLPNEYTQSEYTKAVLKNNPNIIKAKNKAVANLGEMIEIATNKQLEGTEHDDAKDAKLGMYRYTTRFGFSKRNIRGEYAGSNVYEAELLIRHSSDGKMYLYDIVRIKKDTTSSDWLAKNATSAVEKTTGQMGDTVIGNIPRNALGVKKGTKNDKIKFSDRDSDGNQLSVEQQEFFANSKVRLDEDGDYWYGEGAIAPVYHATEAQFTTFKKKYFGQETYATIPEYQATAHLGFWFNTQDPMNSVLKGSKYVVKAYLNIRNPYDANTLDGLATEISILSQNSESPSSMGKAFVRYLKNKGYDGIVIRDEEIGGVSFVAFESNQIKDVTNKAPTPKKDIRFSDRPASILDDEAALRRLITLQNKQQKGGAKITTTSVDAVSRKIVRQLGTEGDSKKLSQLLKPLYDYLKQSPNFTKSDIKEHARPAIEWLQENTESQYNAWDLMKKIYDGYWDVSTLYPVADALQKDINRMKAEYKDKRKEALDKYKENASQREGREKLQKLVLETMKWISSPAKNAPRVPDILKKPYADFLSSIDMSSKRLLAGGDPTKNDLRIASAADTLQKTLANIALGQDPDSGKNAAANQFIDLSEDLVNRFSEFAETVKAMSDGNTFVMRYMSAEQLLQLRKDIRSLNHAIREIDTLNSTDLFANARDLGESSMQSMDELGELKSNIKLKDTAMWDNGLPYYVFKRFGKAGEAIFEGLMNGQDKLAVLARELFTFQQKTWKETEAKQWSEDYHDITLPSGNTIRLTTADAMSIYCLSRRPQGLQHLLGGGIRIIGQKKAGRKVSDSVTLLTLNDIDAITSSLTSKQKSVAEKMQEYMSTTCAEWGNEISMKRFLTKDFNEKYYFPIESDPENRSVKDPGIEQSDLFRLLNISATKALDKNANNRVIIRNVFDVFVNHASDMARLNAYALPLLDYMKWINYRQRSVSDIGQVSTAGVRQSMRKAFGDAAERYVITLIKDVNGKPYDGGDPTILRKMMKAAKTASVGFSLKVSMLQVTSYPRAALVLSTKSLVLGLRKLPNLNRAKKYCPIALWKSFGFYDTNIARSMEEQLKGTTSIKEKLIEWSLKGAELGDGLVWGCLWNACEYEVAATKQYKVGTEEFYHAVGRKLREVIYSTQVVDSVLTRSQLMRKKGGMAQEATAFMSEPTLSANILMDAESRFELEARRSNKRTAWKMHGGHIIRTLGVTSLVGIMTALPEAFWAALRDDDDEKEFAEKFAKEFKESVVLNLLPFNKLPIVSDFAEALLSLLGVGYFSTDKLASTALSRTVSAVKAWDQVLGGDSSTTAYNAMYKTAQAGSTWAGLGFSNLIRDIVTVWNNTAGAADPTLKIRMYEPGRNAWGKMLYRAYVNGDADEAKKIEQKFESENDRKTGLRAAIKAKYEDGTIDSTTAIDHLMEYAEMDEDEAYWKIQEWDGGDDYTKYAEWIDAVRSGKDLSAVIKKYTDNGVETGTLKSQITSQLKNEYVAGDAATKRELQKLIINAYKALGEEVEDAQEAMGAWQYAADYPEYSERVTYNQYQQWVEYGKGKNVTLNTFADVVDYRRNGGDSRSQEEVAKYIDGLSLTKTQKDALWCCLWSEKTLKNAPWN